VERLLCRRAVPVCTYLGANAVAFGNAEHLRPNRAALDRCSNHRGPDRGPDLPRPDW
jgi:hypothetical protein